jgi:putrescine transport system permease protein
MEEIVGRHLNMNKRHSFLTAILALGLFFIYAPMIIVVVYSFNNSRLVTVWSGFSTKWYASLLSNEQLLDAAKLSISVAFVSATIATILGTMAAFALSRYGRFSGRTALLGMTGAPLVMPEVITGLSLLLLFVAIDIDRGFITICLAHITLTMCYVTVIVHSRLITFDRSLEEAAMDLGATPIKILKQITIPIITPSILAGWMLSFSLSMDDLVIASFTTGPSATTLPMRIYSAAHLGVSPEINAISTILITIVTILVIFISITFKSSRIQLH